MDGLLSFIFGALTGYYSHDTVKNALDKKQETSTSPEGGE